MKNAANSRPTHSPIGASSMYRWGNCPGSVKLSEGVPTYTNKYAKEGTEAHGHAAKILENWVEKSPPESNIYVSLSKEAITDRNMQDAIMVYVSCIVGDNTLDSMRFVEVPLNLSRIHPNAYGTADYVQFIPSEKLLRVYDYKHGAGVPVEVENNSQLKYYALGALLYLRITFPNLQIEKIELVIVQPRCYHIDGPVRRAKLTLAELKAFSDELKTKAEATEQPGALLVPGDWCRWCPAAQADCCPALKNKANELAKLEFSAIEKYDPKAMGEVLEWLPILEAWIKQVREFAYNEAIHKQKIPHNFKLVEKRADRVWRDPETFEIDAALAIGLEEKDIYEYPKPKLKSPAKMEKHLGKKDFAEKLNAYVIKKSSGFALVHESDNRSPAKMGAVYDFEAIDSDQSNTSNT